MAVNHHKGKLLPGKMFRKRRDHPDRKRVFQDDPRRGGRFFFHRNPAPIRQDRDDGMRVNEPEAGHRRKTRATLMIGPPQDPALDPRVIDRLLATPGRKIVCGGTTGNIVARRLNRPIRVLLETAAPGVPPIGLLDGVDLLTEGVFTLAGAVGDLRRVSPSPTPKAGPTAFRGSAGNCCGPTKSASCSARRSIPPI